MQKFYYNMILKYGLYFLIAQITKYFISSVRFDLLMENTGVQICYGNQP